MSQPPQDRPDDQSQRPQGPGSVGAPSYGQPPQPEGPERRTGLFVLIGVGALALVLAVVAVAVDVGGRSDTADGGSGRTGGSGSSGGSGSTTAAPIGGTASDAVTAYFTALTQGDPAAAVSYAADPSSVHTTYLTPEVLAASAERAPITDLQVTPTPDPDARSVGVRYRLGTTPVSTAIEVVRTSDDAWKLVAVAADVDVSSRADPSVPMVMNGQKIEPGPLSLLPGTYHFTSGRRSFDYGSEPDLVVRHPADAPDTTRLRPRISSTGSAAALSALRTSWSSCLRSRDPRPGGCPNRWTSSSKGSWKKGTVRWTRKGSDPVKKPRTTSSTTSTTYRVEVDLGMRGTCTTAGRTGPCTGYVRGRATALASFSGDKVRIEWAA